jgi:hypothetical protein
MKKQPSIDPGAVADRPAEWTIIKIIIIYGALSRVSPPGLLSPWPLPASSIAAKTPTAPQGMALARSLAMPDTIPS